MEKKRIFPENTPPQNIPYASANKKLPFSYIVPEDDSIVIEQDANGVLYLSSVPPRVATPVLTIDGLTISAECATEGADIYYTTDGKMPTVESTQYSGPITVGVTTSFRFVALKNGLISSVEATATVVKPKSTDFCLEALEDKTSISLRSKMEAPPVLEISYDDGISFSVWNWEDDGNNTCVYDTIFLDAGETVLIRGVNNVISGGIGAESNFEILSGEVIASGNIMSLLFGESPSIDALSPANNGAFYGLFKDCVNMRSAPDLPAITLAENCYSFMFKNSGIKDAPVLPASTLVAGCYVEIFSGCSNLEEVTVYATQWNIAYTADWLLGVNKDGTLSKLPGTAIPTESDSGVPSGWTVKDL